MTAHEYRRALDAAVEEYEALGEKRREIDTRLGQLTQTIGMLSRLLGLVPTVPLGLTDAVRLVLRSGGLPMTPVEIRDRLVAIGFDTSKYTNNLAALHTILKRLNDSGDVRFLPSTSGKHRYVWSQDARASIVRHIQQTARDNATERSTR